ncbi:MAG: hypothetical protein E6I48_09045 [Chloroflexi bacterium]|nr:MAG: hypothetical protein E6I48_09045 [Chloroflexota bacterium]
MGRLGRGMRWAYRWRAIVLGCSALLSCPISGARTAAVASLCGNGIVEPGEQCDDGGANGSTPCCSASCELIDGDRDGVCDALDPCTNTQLVQIEAPRLVARLTSPGDMTFDVRGAMVVPPSPPIDAASKGIRLVMKNFYEVPLDATVPGGLGWGDSGGGWVYRDPVGANGGITRVVLRQIGATPGALAFDIKGKRARFPDLVGVLPLKVSVVIDSPTAVTGQCGEEYVRTALCALNSSGRTLSCGPLRSPFSCRSPLPDALVRCDLARAVAAQEAYWTPHLAYYSGPCSGLPGFVPSPGVACTTTGTSANFIVVTAHGAARDACAWNSCLAPGRPHVVCKRGAISASCSG